MWYPVLQGSVGHIRYAIFNVDTTLLPNLFMQCCIPDKWNPHTIMLHSLLRLLILIMRGKIVFASVSGKFLIFLVSKAGYI